MAPNSLSTDKRLEGKRVVRRMAKNVRRSIRSTSRIDERQEMWRNLEKQQPDEVSRTAASQLLLLRLELKEMLRDARNNNFPLGELMSSTGLGEECVRTILEKYGYGDEKQADPENSEKEESRKSTSPAPSHGHDRAANVRFDMPRLDMTSVRKGGKSPEKENSDGTLSGEEFDDVVVAAETPPANRASVANITAVSGKSPREVTDSSAEISDLAKRLGSRLYQDASLIDQLKNFNREKTFVDQLKDIVATSATLSTVQLKFIPSVPLAKPVQPPIAVCNEIDVQTSICIAELPAIPKEMRDNATDLPSLDYLGSSELGGLQQIPQSFTVHEDVSSSAFSSDQSAGQVPAAIIGTRTTIPFTYDGSVHLTPSRTVQVSELSSLSAIEEGLSVRKQLPESSNRSGARTPRVSESPWRPSSRRLHLEEVNISTSQEDSNSLEVISVGTPKKQPANLPLRLDFGPSTNGESLNGESGTPLSLELSKDSLDSSHHDDEEHTYNQVSQIYSE